MTFTVPGSPPPFGTAYAAKINAAGLAQWAVKLTITDTSIGAGIGVDAMGNAYLV